MSTHVRHLLDRAAALLRDRLELDEASTSLANEYLYQAARGRARFVDRGARADATLAGVWEMVGGDGRGWPAGFHYKVRGLAVHDGRLFASITGPRTDGGRGEVHAFDGREWTMVAGGDHGPWSSGEGFVEHLASDGESLYAAARGALWRWRAGRWEDVSVGQPWHGSERAGPYSLLVDGERLVVGFWGDASVHEYRGGGWRVLAGDGGAWRWPQADGYRTAYSLAMFRGELHVGLGSGSYGRHTTSVWRLRGEEWERVGGLGVRGGWRGYRTPFPLAMTEYRDRLVTTLSRPVGTPAMASTVWSFDGEQWRPVATGTTPELMARSLIPNDCIVFRDRLLVATGDDTHPQAAVWALVGEHAWQPLAPASQFVAADRPAGRGQWIYRLAEYEGDLYAGTAGYAGCARVWRFRPDGARGHGRAGTPS